ncbi:hypothetical protein VPNG_08851 [Cytospora leucostoma]|uniref:Uncharacterized protein n=1 Tax=Cytospora leucostoma TaxID=1230097 RepID=A0A423VRP5_9PEZI|nr:hypothetical protein VPNG_08851 [Cytospora leucostoma]
MTIEIPETSAAQNSKHGDGDFDEYDGGGGDGLGDIDKQEGVRGCFGGWISHGTVERHISR